MAPAGAEGTIQAGGDPQHAAVTQAAMTGLSAASAPYGGSASYGGALSTQTNPFNPNYADPAFGTAPASTGTTATTTATGAGTVPFDNPSQELLERDYLLGRMHTDSMNMLVLQSEVQNQNRQYTLVSNMLQSRDRTLHNMIQNMRGM